MANYTRVLLKAWNDFLSKDQNVQASYNMLKTIEADHARIHEGIAYSFGERFTTSAGSSQYYLFQPASDTSLHLRSFGYKSTAGPCEIDFYENPFTDINSLGVQKIPRNMNRGSSNVSSAGLYANPFIDVNSLGVSLDPQLIEATAGGPIKASGGAGGSLVTEWVVPNGGNSYLMKFTPIVVTSGHFHSFWYEP